MVNLVLRKDVMSLKEATKQVQTWVDVDIHEAADLVYSILEHHDAPIQFWKLPINGLPFKDTDPATKGYLTEFRESRWWDDDHQREQEELRKLAGVKYSQRLDKIEDVALLRTDVDKLFAGARKRASERGDGRGDPEFIKSKNMWESATAMPKNRLVSITKLCAALSSHSGEKAPTWEFVSAFSDAYDGDKTMIYRGGTGWNAEPILEGGYYGYNKRTDISCDFVNSGHAGDSKFDQYLILKEDAELIGNRIWRKFFGNESWIDTPFFDELTCEKAATVEAKCSDDASKNELASKVTPDHAAIAESEPDIDPLDLPPELDAANMAYRAVLNGFGNPAATFKNRLIDYLEKSFIDLIPEAVQRIATVANPDKTTGRKKRDKE